MNTQIVLLSTDEVKKISDSYGFEHFPVRMAQSSKYIRQQDRLHSIGAGILLYEVLRINEKDLSFYKNSKPYVKNFNVRFNLSHSGNYILLACDSGEIGADIEIICSRNFEIAKKVFLPQEREWMSKNPIDGFFTLWTLKESVMKQQGLGFAMRPDSFSVMPLINGNGIKTGKETLFASTIKYDNHIISVCTEKKLKNIAPQILSLT